MTTSSGGGDRVSLSRELSEFLIEFAIALNRTAMYPQGHPSMDEAARVVVEHLATLLYDRVSLSIGVARRQLVIEGVATDVRNPVLTSLAERLHLQHIGAITFQVGVTADEIGSALRLLARERAGTPALGMGDASELEVGPHVRLYPLTFEKLEMAGGEGGQASEEDDPNQASRVAGLWIGMARAALAVGDGEIEPARTDAANVARAINEHPAAKAYDQVIVGYLLQLANELKTEGGTATAAVRRRLSRLIEGLRPETLGRLLDMGGDVGQRRRFLLDATEALAADAVVELVRATGEATDRPISEAMLRILQKLSIHAEAGVAHGTADFELREQVRRLVTNWTLEDPNPSEYGKALQTMSGAAALSFATLSERHPAEPLRVLQMAVELGTGGPGLQRAVHELLEEGRLSEVVRHVDHAPRSDATEAVWRVVTQPDHVLLVLKKDGVDPAVFGRILARADPAELTKVLLDAQATETNAERRHAFVEALTRVGPEVGVEAAARLADPTFEARATVLGLLNELQTLPQGLTPLSWARSPDPALRKEALQLATRIPADRERAIALALNDEDERVVRVGVRGLQTGLPEAALPLLAQRAGDARLPMDLRAQLVRALGTTGSPLALEALLRVTTNGRTLFGRPRLAPRSAECLAGLSVLAERWSSDAKAARVLKRARKSSDPDVRTAAGAGA